MASRTLRQNVCARCAFDLLLPRNSPSFMRGPRKSYATKSGEQSTTKETENAAENTGHAPTRSSNAEPGPLARRLEEATEEVLYTGGKAGRRAIEDAGFSEELKERLLAKVKDAQFRSENPSAFAEADMPASAGQGTRITATSQPWTGQETTEDTVLRMLTDAHKPLKRELRGRPGLSHLQPVDMRVRQRSNPNSVSRAADARDKASIYTSLGIKGLDKQLSENEKKARRDELRARFQPAARAMPNTLGGLASLANQRIEDAIAKGQFKNIPRGKGVERDTRSDNPFIDTTEYIMNKMIKRQDIVPPWIEKQQELVKAARVFRTRLRQSWKRHAARTISRTGGSLEDQMERARRFAKAEEIQNPRQPNVEQMAIPTNVTDDVVMAKIRQQTNSSSPSAEKPADVDSSTVESDLLLPAPLRDPEWLRTEKAYLELCIDDLNKLTRSYNLMAPELAKKPYFSVQRELDNCYAEVAPLLAETIKERATQPSRLDVGTVGVGPSSILERFGNNGPRVKIHESKAPPYGFKEFWRDLFRR